MNQAQNHLRLVVLWQKKPTVFAEWWVVKMLTMSLLASTVCQGSGVMFFVLLFHACLILVHPSVAVSKYCILLLCLPPLFPILHKGGSLEASVLACVCWNLWLPCTFRRQFMSHCLNRPQLKHVRIKGTRWFKYDRDWFVCKQAALRRSCATLREWSHNLHPPSCSG